jgi:hypothetical protein
MLFGPCTGKDDFWRTSRLVRRIQFGAVREICALRWRSATFEMSSDGGEREFNQRVVRDTAKKAASTAPKELGRPQIIIAQAA